MAPSDAVDVSGAGLHEAALTSAAPAAFWVTVVRAVLGGGLVLALSITVAWGARRHILASPRFAVDDIVVTGAHHRSPEQLAALAGVVRGMNVFGIDLERARGRLLADPWVETATIARRLPGRVLIQVTEREIGGVVALPETYLAARDGTIFKRFEPGDPVDLPVVTGVTADAISQDREGVKRTVARALDLAADYEHGPLGAREPLQEIHVSNGGALTLVVGKDGLSLALGLPPFRRKLEQTARIFGELERRGTKPSLIMLDDEARPERVVVRTR